ncbi:MAG: hypothetical protein R6W78_09505 [Bacteroidales bacterium]
MKKRTNYKYLHIFTFVSAFLIFFSSCKQDKQNICDSDLYEPNDSFNSAYFIGEVQESSMEIVAQVSSRNDLDFYQIRAKENIRTGFPESSEYFRIRFQLISPPGKDYDLYIYNDSRSQLEYSANRGNMEEVSEYFWTGKIINADDKEFFIEVRPFTKDCDFTDYRLSVTMSYSSMPF